MLSITVVAFIVSLLPPVTANVPMILGLAEDLAFTLSKVAEITIQFLKRDLCANCFFSHAARMPSEHIQVIVSPCTRKPLVATQGAQQSSITILQQSTSSSKMTSQTSMPLVFHPHSFGTPSHISESDFIPLSRAGVSVTSHQQGCLSADNTLRPG